MVLVAAAVARRCRSGACQVELGGVFKVGDATHAGLFRDPALVPYVPVPAALVGRHDDPHRLRRGPLRGLQPGAPAAVLLDVAARLPGLTSAPGPPGSEHASSPAGRPLPPAPLPSGLHACRRSACASPRVRVSTAMRGSPPRTMLRRSGCLRRLVTLQPVVAVKLRDRTRPQQNYALAVAVWTRSRSGRRRRSPPCSTTARPPAGAGPRWACRGFCGGRGSRGWCSRGRVWPVMRRGRR